MFPQAAPWLLRIPQLEERYGLQATFDNIEAEAWQLWLICEDSVVGVLLTMIMEYPRRRELQLLGLAGTRIHAWIHLIDRIEEYALKNGCNVVTLSAVRKGLGKMLPEYTGNRIYLERAL